ncbi:hypothetical protein G6F63_015733 [Rhizopus arrhizus]|uniref:Uncharacterized protein n=1 Tax=Rhizopus oryzae TaxID=64495 RepID=A0A9P7BYX3_RHIOR|nr:hypothetical protein G6F63_015733 [Rhizopus arrhizus]KAG1385505.1 hypothetical protein G6F59_017365 [Rhizopus arrhizus]KAG1387169.1 hypothetical protein G6F58_013694 [Rhizopus delemar]KAG1523563.1 hypothetical protein G6F51_014506 [Rhizopus arrhizus]
MPWPAASGSCSRRWTSPARRCVPGRPTAAASATPRRAAGRSLPPCPACRTARRRSHGHDAGCRGCPARTPRSPAGPGTG